MSELEPSPSFDVTYRRADGESIADEYGWMTSLDYLDDESDPVEVVEERWKRVTVRTFWHLPTTLYSCTKEDDCDEDAVAWEQMPDGPDWIYQSDRWVQVCAQHRAQQDQTTVSDAVAVCDEAPAVPQES